MQATVLFGNLCLAISESYTFQYIFSSFYVECRQRQIAGTTCLSLQVAVELYLARCTQVFNSEANLSGSRSLNRYEAISFFITRQDWALEKFGAGAEKAGDSFCFAQQSIYFQHIITQVIRF